MIRVTNGYALSLFSLQSNISTVKWEGVFANDPEVTANKERWENWIRDTNRLLTRVGWPSQGSSEYTHAGNGVFSYGLCLGEMAFSAMGGGFGWTDGDSTATGLVVQLNASINPGEDNQTPPGFDPFSDEMQNVFISPFTFSFLFNSTTPPFQGLRSIMPAVTGNFILKIQNFSSPFPVSCLLPNGTCVTTTLPKCNEANGWASGKIEIENPECPDVETPADRGEEPLLKKCFNETPTTDSGFWAKASLEDYPSELECEASCTPNRKGKAMSTTKGPGTYLKNMLSLIGIRAKEKGCKCAHMEKKMNKGPQWCRDHREEILDHLAKESKKRGLPFVRIAADRLVELAIRRAEARQ